MVNNRTGWLDKLRTPGTRTTEFWLTILVEVGATIAFIRNGLDGSQWVDISKVVIGAYTLSRGVRKHGKATEH